MSKIITIDCDNVLADTAGSFVNRYMAQTGLPLSIDELDGQYLAQCTPLQSMTAEVGDPYLPFRADVVDLESSTEILPVEGSVEAVRSLRKDGWTCIMVTGRGIREQEETYRRVDQWFAGWFDQIVFGYECTDQYVDKGTLCQQLGSRVHIDDFLHNAQVIATHQIPTLLFDRARNQSQESDPSIVRVSGWEDSLTWIVENLGSDA